MTLIQSYYYSNERNSYLQMGAGLMAQFSQYIGALEMDPINAANDSNNSNSSVKHQASGSTQQGTRTGFGNNINATKKAVNPTEEEQNGGTLLGSLYFMGAITRKIVVAPSFESDAAAFDYSQVNKAKMKSIP